MARPTPRAQVSVAELVLGLVIEQSGNGYQLGKRLESRFASAEFASEGTTDALKALHKRGLVRKAGGFYEATDEGIKHFEGWLLASAPMPPVREELLARMELCRPADLPRLIEVVREATLACTAKVEHLNKRLREPGRALDDLEEFRRQMRIVIMSGDIAWWDGRMRWLQECSVFLERQLQRWRQSEQAARPSQL